MRVGLFTDRAKHNGAIRRLIAVAILSSSHGPSLKGARRGDVLSGNGGTGPLCTCVLCRVCRRGAGRQRECAAYGKWLGATAAETTDAHDSGTDARLGLGTGTDATETADAN